LGNFFPPQGNNQGVGEPVTLPIIGREPPKPHYPRMCMIADPGWGKTSFAAYAVDPVLIMSRDETGYNTL